MFPSFSSWLMFQNVAWCFMAIKAERLQCASLTLESLDMFSLSFPFGMVLACKIIQVWGLGCQSFERRLAEVEAELQKERCRNLDLQLFT